MIAMILRINKQLANSIRNMTENDGVKTSNNINASRGIFKMKLDHKIDRFSFSHHGFIFQNRYNYRSEQRFIDFKKDYYQILGISQTAQLHLIKQAFYILAKEYHPDRNKGNDDKFKEINEAYNVLSQPNLKKQYDSSRFKDQSNQAPGEDDSLKDEGVGRGSLNYGAYSQLSRLQWAIYRSGYMKHNRTDYSNYEKKYDAEADYLVEIKKRGQWHQAFRNMSVDQLKEQVQFRQKLYRKYQEDIQTHISVRQQYIDYRLKSIGNKIERFLGKRIRRFYDRLIQK